MKYSFFALALITILSSCNYDKNQLPKEIKESPTIESIRVDRFSVKNGDPDSLTLSNYIKRTYGNEGTELKSVYYSTDHSVMMQFVNKYDEGNKIRVDWVNADEELVKYVKNTYNEENRLIKSESFSTQDEFQSGFIHNWKEDGKIEEKGPIEPGQPFKPNAIYTYNDQDEFAILKEYDANDSLYAVVKWNYTSSDAFGNWIERQMITNDTINQVEKRLITYSIEK